MLFRVTQGHSRKPICNILLAINTDLHLLSQLRKLLQILVKFALSTHGSSLKHACLG